MSFLKEAWSFYINLLLNSENMAVRIATFTATLAALTFLINFILKPSYTYLRRHFAKIKVETTIHQQLIQTFGQVTTGDPKFTVIITNASHSVKFIKSITFRTSVKVDGERFWSPIVESGSFPVRLEQGQQYRRDFSITSLNNAFLKDLNQKATISVIAFDTVDKKYYSRKTKVSTIISNLNVAQTFKPQQ